MVIVLLSLGVLASIALIVAGALALRKGGERKRPALMIVASLVTLTNVWLYATMPAPP